MRRIRKKVARERTRFNRLYQESTSGLTKERAFGETNVCNFVIRLIDDELKKAGD